MPIEESTTLNITCDNPKCRGHRNLDPAKRDGWVIVSHEVYGQPTQQNVFGDYDCLAETSSDVTVTAQWAPAPVEPTGTNTTDATPPA